MHIEREELLERYVSNRLSDAERDQVEEHYFGCEHCFRRLELLRMIGAELAAARDETEAEAGSSRSRRRWAWLAVVTATAALAIGLWMRQPPPGTPTPGSQPPLAGGRPAAPAKLEELARVEAPPYTPVVLRGNATASDRRFRAAMALYQKKDYAGAAAGLRGAAAADPSGAQTHFFLSICYLLTEQADSAISSLQETVALGDTPYLEDAHYYLAKAYLRKGDVEAASRELDEAIALGGSQQQEAQALLMQLKKLGTAAR